MNRRNMDSGGAAYNNGIKQGPVAVGTRGTVGSLIRKEIEYFKMKKTDSHKLPQPTTFHNFHPSSNISHHHHQEAATAAGNIGDNYYCCNNNNTSNKRKVRQSSTTSSSSSWFFGMSSWNMRKKHRVAAGGQLPRVDKDLVIPPFSYVILKDHHI